MYIPFDIETLPGDLNKVEEDIAEIAETEELSCPIKLKGDLIEALGGNDQLKYKKVEELQKIWCESPENKMKSAEDKYRKRSFDAVYGRVLSVAWRDTEEVAAMTLGLGVESERELLILFKEALLLMCTRDDGRINQPTFVAHHAPFDLKFLFQRMVINNIEFPINLPFGGWHGKDYFCTSTAWCGRDGRIKQDHLCKALGIEGKPDDIDGSKVFDVARAGDFKRIQEYNIDDVEKLTKIFNRLI